MKADSSVSGKLKLPRLISDGMVLQRDTEVKIWGWAEKGDTVIVKFAGSIFKSIAGDDGKWETIIRPMPAGGPYTMEISAYSNGDGTGCIDSGAEVGKSGAAKHIVINDIMAGDVWVCSGQSNMQTPVLRVIEQFGKEVREACCSDIRYFQVPERYDFNDRQIDLEGGCWACPDQNNVLEFSALALFYALEIHKRYSVPVGIINASIGGTPIEAWMSEDSLKDWPLKLDELARCKDGSYIAGVMKSEAEAIAQWFDRLDQLDAGLADSEGCWTGDKCDNSQWPSANLPASWPEIGIRDFYGSIWLKKELEIPVELAGKPAVLRLGTIVDSDAAYINGVEVGATTYRYPPRKYDVPAGIIKGGKNIITIRTVSNAGDGGLVEEKPYSLELGSHIFDLAGEWKYKIGAAMDRPLPGMTFFSYKPAGLFNGMISPLLGYTLKGVLWYQGESNTTAAREYTTLFSRMISEWRSEWKLGNLPFFFVQLANFMRPASEPGPSEWAELREAQMKALDLPDTGMAVAIDIGEWNDIHPVDKMTVAQRLALCARKTAYGEEIICSGPLCKDWTIDGSHMTIRFHEETGRLVSKGGEPLRQFSIAGADQKFIWANAVIKDNSVIVWNNEIMEPVAVRYAWADNPEGANLYNEEGLPASPFRTDDWDH